MWGLCRSLSVLLQVNLSFPVKGLQLEIIFLKCILTRYKRRQHGPRTDHVTSHCSGVLDRSLYASRAAAAEAAATTGQNRWDARKATSGRSRKSMCPCSNAHANTSRDRPARSSRTLYDRNKKLKVDCSCANSNPMHLHMKMKSSRHSNPKAVTY